ncbi:hypothetical protein [Escherichia coli]|uniref:hypothetical protein n=1 Tax=Escherichia coli TaxID=562 RepID=UPI001F10ABA1|nr:hypothetical protein [Escherichia coli]
MTGRGRDLWWHDLVEQASDQHQAEEMNAEDPLLFSTPPVLPVSQKVCCILPAVIWCTRR